MAGKKTNVPFLVGSGCGCGCGAGLGAGPTEIKVVLQDKHREPDQTHV